MGASPDCVFCKIVAGEIPCFRVHEDAETLAFMDINPLADGHCLVIPKAHHADAYAISDADMAVTARAARKVATAVRDALAPEGLNLFQCNGLAAGQSVYHFHIHVIPRATGDSLAMNWEPKPGDMDHIKTVAERIAARMS